MKKLTKLGILVIIVLVLLSSKKTYIYKYHDLNGNIGQTNHCRYIYIRKWLNNQKMPICEVNGTILQVKEYKKELKDKKMIGTYIYEYIKSKPRIIKVVRDVKK